MIINKVRYKALFVSLAWQEIEQLVEHSAWFTTLWVYRIYLSE